MKISAIFLAIGASLLGYAYTLPPYKDEDLFMEQYMKLSTGQSDEFWRLRDEMLTPKFQLEDYGITLVAAAIAIFIATRKGCFSVVSPGSRKTMLCLAVALPFITIAGYVFDLFQGYHRGEFPHWADSLGIPLMAAPIQFIILLIWSLAHFLFLRATYQPGVTLLPSVPRRHNWWLLLFSVITGLIVFASAVTGEYWYAVPGMLWLYYYFSLGAVRTSPNPSFEGTSLSGPPLN